MASLTDGERVATVLRPGESVLYLEHTRVIRYVTCILCWAVLLYPIWVLIAWSVLGRTALPICAALGVLSGMANLVGGAYTARHQAYVVTSARLFGISGKHMLIEEVVVGPGDRITVRSWRWLGSLITVRPRPRANGAAHGPGVRARAGRVRRVFWCVPDPTRLATVLEGLARSTSLAGDPADDVAE